MKLSIFSFLVLLCLSSCTRTVTLGYSPIVEKQTENHIVLKVDDLEDSRVKKTQQVGALKNGYGLTLVKLVTEENVPHWISNAMKTELQNAGYQIAQENEDALYTIEGKVLNTFAYSYFLYHGNVSVDMALKKEGHVIFQKIYISDKNNGVNWANLSSSCIKSLENNLQTICQTFVTDVNEALLLNSHKNELEVADLVKS